MTDASEATPVDQARRAVAAAAGRSGVELTAVEDMDTLREVSDLFARVWGRSDEGVPMHSEAIRSLAHAGGLVTVARDRANGRLLGAAALGRDVPGWCYSYLAAVAPGSHDRGIGWALKHHQRSWALSQELQVMSWTFDPLVSRNGRFNTVKLGALVEEYEPAFYGQMSDDLNGGDIGDRMVVRWHLGSARALAAADGALAGPETPCSERAEVVEVGPDGAAAYLESGSGADRWVRVPADIVRLRKEDPDQAAAWRGLTSRWLSAAFAAGLVADGVSREGWYHLGPSV
ncbi:GNAT family N-acetyltransferase [Ornithinimicrobium sp. Y1694]|uniref:GNAT family N-acetyltransferase n=1 Tax=Ornithinimicrobium sp. Y1694 TaxID=3418590 RepID=UPI003CFB5256